MAKKIKKIKKIVPVGSLVLVERLKNSDVHPSSILSANSDEHSNQAIVIDIGPMFNAEKYGIKIGDRVVLQGQFVPFSMDDEHKEFNLVLPDMIKAILIEE